MNLGSVTSSLASALGASDATQSAQSGVQLSLLKKSLNSQEQMASELFQQMGKGQNVDIQA